MIWTAIPSRTDEYFDKLITSMALSERRSIHRVVVADNGLSTELRQKWSLVGYTVPATPFVFAQAINACVRQMPPNADILVLNDDTTVVTPEWLTTAEYIMGDISEKYGLISFAISGGVGNPEQGARSFVQGEPKVLRTEKTLCFVASVIRRAAWNEVGPLDEQFTSYGWDDDDYCRRLRDAGWLTGVTQNIVVTHGQAGFPHSSSYRRYHGQDGMDRLFYQNRDRYIAKWGALPV